MNDRGFTLLELLIACALLLVVTGAVATMAVPLRDAFERAIGATDLTGGARVVLDRLAAEAREAGSSAAVAVGRFRLSNVVATVVPLSDLDGGSASGIGTAVRITRIPLGAPQGVLQTGAAAGEWAVQLETSAPCTAVGIACGFRPGMPIIIHDDVHAQMVTVQSVGSSGAIGLASPLASAFAAGSVVAAVSIVSYGVRPEADGSLRLVRATAGAEQPVLQSVVDFEVAILGTDPLHARQVDFRLRIEAPSAALRGPMGPLFRRPGTAMRSSKWVPDLDMRTSVALRNLPG
jgi:prepilin-type N-terminal cleavage/methylation domain-containing protein